MFRASEPLAIPIVRSMEREKKRERKRTSCECEKENCTKSYHKIDVEI